MIKEALLYEKMDRGRVRCRLCSHFCVIPEGKLGVCWVRENQGGKLHTLVYGSAISRNVDPIEKKPLYHFYPGSRSFSIATAGCNFRCQWCQNWRIAQMPRLQSLPDVRDTSPADIVALAEESASRSIAYTYTEPTIFFEYALDTARLAKQAGIANVYVTNGYMSAEMLDLFHPYLDAANVDIKAFRKKTYHRYIGAGLQPVLDAAKKMKALGIWLEVTTLLIPDLNDDPAEVAELAAFIAGELGPETPWHISRFSPHHQLMDTPATPHETLDMAYEAGKLAGLRYVYLGNVHGESNTHCHACGEILIRRIGYSIGETHVHKGKCAFCEEPIPGVWGKQNRLSTTFTL